MKLESKINEMRYERNNGLDALKFMAAFMVVCIHIQFPGEVGGYLTTLARVSVPIFFMITGYFYQNIVDNKKIKRQ